MTLLLLLACRPEHVSSTSPERCSAPEVGAAVLTLSSTDLVADRTLEVTEDALVHMIAADADQDFAYLGGTGGLRVLALGEQPTLVGSWFDPRFTDLGFVGLLEGDQLLVSTAGRGFSALLDVSDPTSPQVEQIWPEIEILAAEAVEEGLLLLTADGELTLQTPQGPVKVFRVSGPRDMLVRGRVAIVAEQSWGLTMVDLDGGPSVSIQTLAPPTSLALVGDVLFAAEGSQGIETFDLSDPSDPQPLGLLRTPGTAQDLALSGDTLWVAAMDDLVAVDVSKPSEPWVAGRADSLEFSLSVVPTQDGALFVDWSYAHRVWRSEFSSPVLALSRRNLVVDGSTQVSVSNLGRDTLELPTLSALGRGVEVGKVARSLEPGETSSFDVSVEPGAEGSVCLASTDPSQPLLHIPVHQGDGVELAVGQRAPDFDLQDLSGDTYQLSSARGHSVVLVFFATWCPICPPELLDLQARAAELDAEIWLVAPMDDVDTLQSFVAVHGLDLPVLVDPGGVVHAQWQQTAAFDQVLFPQNWVVGPSGTIVYASNRYEPDALVQVVSEQASFSD